MPPEFYKEYDDILFVKIFKNVFFAHFDLFCFLSLWIIYKDIYKVQLNLFLR